MRDPHVVSLTYNVILNDGIMFQSSTIHRYENDLLSLHLEGDILTIMPKQHYASLEEALTEIAPFLRSWQLDDALQMGRLSFRFEYSDVEIVDRDPPLPGESQTIQLRTLEITSVVDNTTVELPRINFPHPPSSFYTSPDVETLWHRYEMYTNGKEPLPGMAYFCLTFLEARGGTRAGASTKFNISEDVLNKLGELTSEYGDPSVARKFPRKKQPIPFSPAEITWIEATVKEIIRRIGEQSVIGQLPIITMSNLPTL